LDTQLAAEALKEGEDKSAHFHALTVVTMRLLVLCSFFSLICFFLSPGTGNFANYVNSTGEEEEEGGDNDTGVMWNSADSLVQLAFEGQHQAVFTTIYIIDMTVASVQLLTCVCCVLWFVMERRMHFVLDGLFSFQFFVVFPLGMTVLMLPLELDMTIGSGMALIVCGFVGVLVTLGLSLFVFALDNEKGGEVFIHAAEGIGKGMACRLCVFVAV
jgi:hypothetical protein